MGEAPEHIVLVETEADVDALEVADPERVAYISQTTLSVDETRTIINRLREKFPSITGPRTDDICYATTNRQAAVKQMAGRVRPRARDRLAELLELPAPRRRRARLRRRGAPDRQRGPGPRGVARGQARRRHLVRRERARGARRSGSSRSSASAAPRTSRSSRSSARTCASCCPRRSARPWPRATPSRRLGLAQPGARIRPPCSSSRGGRRRTAAACRPGAAGARAACRRPRATGSSPSDSASA